MLSEARQSQDSLCLSKQAGDRRKWLPTFLTSHHYIQCSGKVRKTEVANIAPADQMVPGYTTPIYVLLAERKLQQPEIWQALLEQAALHPAPVCIS